MDSVIVFQALAGTITLGAVGGGVAYFLYEKQTANDEEEKKESPQSFVLPQSHYIAKLSTKSNNQPSKELYESEVKNFLCSFTVDGSAKQDKECDIFKSDEAETDKLKSFSQFTENTKITKTDLNSNGVYVTIKSKSIDEISNWSTLNITLKSTVSSESTKNYGVFSLIYKVNSNNPEGETKLWITKASLQNPLDTNAGTKTEAVNEWFCKKPEAKDTPTDCEIFGPKTNTENLANVKDLKLKDVEKIKKIDDIKPDVFYVLNWKENKQIIQNNSKNVSVWIKKTENSQAKYYKVANLHLFVPLSDEDSFDSTTSKPIILS